MSFRAAFVFIAMCSVSFALQATSALGADKEEKEAAFSFADVKYYHRFTEKDLHEYTPEGQEDLGAWKDMVTINYYPPVKDGEALANIANGVLGNYKRAKALIVKTDSVPRTKEKEAEHLAVAVFVRPEFAEVAFARIRMHEGVGTSVVYSHRTYGKDVKEIGNEVSEWLKKNGAATEKVLMKWDAMPKVPAASK